MAATPARISPGRTSRAVVPFIAAMGVALLPLVFRTGLSARLPRPLKPA